MSTLPYFLLLTYRSTLVGTENHIYFVIFITTFTACVLTFDYLAWICEYHRAFDFLSLTITDLVTLNGAPPRSSCVLPHEVCRLVSGDMFLSSVAAWSSLQLMWSGIVAVNYGDEVWRVCRRSVKGLFETIAFNT